MNEENIRGHRWKKGQSGNPKGRPPKLANAIDNIPRDAQERIYAVLHHALSLPNVKEAQKYFEKEDLGEYGYVLQIALRSMAGKTGWLTVCDILDRLFGKPRQTTEMHITEAEDIRPEINIE